MEDWDPSDAYDMEDSSNLFEGEPEIDFEQVYDMGGELSYEDEPDEIVDYEAFSKRLNMPVEYLRDRSKDELEIMVQNLESRPRFDSEEIGEQIELMKAEKAIPPSLLEEIEILKRNYKLACKDFKKGKKDCVRYYNDAQIKDQHAIEDELHNILRKIENEDLKNEIKQPFIIIRFGSNECYQRDILDMQLLYWQKQSREAQFKRKESMLQEEGRVEEFRNLLNKLELQIKNRSRFSKSKVDTRFPYGSPQQLLMANNFKLYHELKQKYDDGEFVNEYEFLYELYSVLRSILLVKTKKERDEINFIKATEDEFPILLSSFPKKENVKEIYKQRLNIIKMMKDAKKRKTEMKKLKQWLKEYKPSIYSGDDMRRFETVTQYYNFDGPLIKGKGRKKQVIWSKKIQGLTPDEFEVLHSMRDSMADELLKQEIEYKRSLAKRLAKFVCSSKDKCERRMLLERCIQEEAVEEIVEEEDIPINNEFKVAAKQLGIRDLKRYERFFKLSKYPIDPERPFKTDRATAGIVSQFAEEGEKDDMDELEEFLTDMSFQPTKKKSGNLRTVKEANRPKYYYLVLDGKSFTDKDKYIFHKTLYSRRVHAAHNIHKRLKQERALCVKRYLEESGIGNQIRNLVSERNRIEYEIREIELELGSPLTVSRDPRMRGKGVQSRYNEILREIEKLKETKKDLKERGKSPVDPSSIDVGPSVNPFKRDIEAIDKEIKHLESLLKPLINRIKPLKANLDSKTKQITKLRTKMDKDTLKQCGKSPELIVILGKLTEDQIHSNLDEDYFSKMKEVCTYFYIRSRESLERAKEFAEYRRQLQCDDFVTLMEELQLSGKRKYSIYEKSDEQEQLRGRLEYLRIHLEGVELRHKGKRDKRVMDYISKIEGEITTLENKLKSTNKERKKKRI